MTEFVPPNKNNTIKLLCFVISICTSFLVNAQVNQYLPVNLNPSIERKLDQLFIISGHATAKKPYTVKQVKQALNSCSVNYADICHPIIRYLTRFDKQIGVTHASLGLSYSNSDYLTTPNQRGAQYQDHYQASFQGYYRYDDWMAVNLGGISSDSMTSLEGSYLSLGWQYAQVDIGYKSRWTSPLQSSATIFSTQAEPYFSINVSSQQPIDWLWGFSYDLNWGKLSTSDKILSKGKRTTGEPNFITMQLALQPQPWVTLGLNRNMQFGGGGRGEPDFWDILAAFFCPSCVDNTKPGVTNDTEFGNQQISFFSKFVFEGKVPVSIYAEYAGEDTAKGSSLRIGNTMGSFGIDFPRLWQHFDLQYEASTWQNAWYQHTVYGDGTTHYQQVIGHWAFNQYNKGKWGSSRYIHLGYQLTPNDYLKLSYRQHRFHREVTDYSKVISLSYQTPIDNFQSQWQIAYGKTHREDNIIKLEGSLSW